MNYLPAQCLLTIQWKRFLFWTSPFADRVVHSMRRRVCARRACGARGRAAISTHRDFDSSALWAGLRAINDSEVVITSDDAGRPLFGNTSSCWSIQLGICMPSRRYPSFSVPLLSSAILAVCVLCSSAQAQTGARTFLSADEIQKQLSGHKLIVTLTGAQYGRKDDFVSSGIVYSISMQNQMMSGSRGRGEWKINPDGSLCVKRNPSDPPACSYTFRDGDHWARTAQPTDDAPVISTFVIED